LGNKAGGLRADLAYLRNLEDGQIRLGSQIATTCASQKYKFLTTLVAHSIEYTTIPLTCVYFFQCFLFNKRIFIPLLHRFGSDGGVHCLPKILKA